MAVVTLPSLPTVCTVTITVEALFDRSAAVSVRVSLAVPEALVWTIAPLERSVPRSVVKFTP